MIQANIPILTIQNVRIVNSYRTHLFSNINDLMAVLLFSRIVKLNSWIVAVTVPSRMITFPLGDLRCSWQDLF